MSVAKKEHGYYCFQVLEAELESKPEPQPPFDTQSEEYPLFVTWNIWSNSRRTTEPSLRGCIGTFQPLPLAEGLAEYASIAAFKDHRFSPISKAELSRLECGVSLLTGFEDCSDYEDWEIGTHGIYIHLPKSRQTATYLPDVMPAQNWTKQEAIDSAIRKAGFTGKINAELRRALRVQRYRSEKVEVSYTEFQTWKEEQLSTQ